jgi:hypothetical protein
MKQSISILIFIIFLSCSNNKKEEQMKEPGKLESKDARVVKIQVEGDTLKGSLKAIATGRIGNTFTTIHYHSPAVRGRVVWGGLVPFEQVWVTGAHMATSIEFEGPVRIGEKELAAGKYGFFTIPSQTEWTIMINKNWEQHLTDEYDQKDDLIRLTIKPETLTENQERLMYAVDNTAISIRWEKIKLSIPVSSN